MKRWLILLLCPPAYAGPFVVSDPVPSTAVQPTHCGVWLDTQARTEIEVTPSAAGPYCKVDVGTVTIGSHTLRMTHVRKDAIWGDMESAQSSPFPFTKPTSPAAPAGVSLSK